MRSAQGLFFAEFLVALVFARGCHGAGLTARVPRPAGSSFTSL